MSVRTGSGAGGTAYPASPGGRSGGFLLPALVVTGGALLGLLVAARPGLFHVELALDPRTAAALAGGLALAAMVLRRPGTGPVVLALFVWLNLSEILVRYHGFPSLLQLLALPLALAAWIEAGPRRVLRAAGSPLALALAGYSLVLFASTLWAWDRGLADAEVAEAAKAFVLFLLFVVLASSLSRLRRAVAAMVAAGSLLAGLGVYQWATGSFGSELGGLARIKQAQIYDDVFEPRIAGPLGDPNFFAQILLVLTPLSLALAWTARGRVGRLLGYGATALLIAGTVLTYSRGAALALALVLALSLAAHGVRGRDVAAAALLVALALPFLPADFTRRLETLEQVLPWNEEQALRPDSSFEERRLVTGAAWEMFLDHPVRGVGAGNYTARYHPYGDRVGSTARLYGDPFGDHYPHNLYLEIGAETGVVGLVAFGLLLAVAVGVLESARERFARAARSGGGEAERAGAVLARATEIAILGYLVSSLFLHGHFLRYLWLLLAVGAALHLVSRGVAAGTGEAGATAAAADPAVAEGEPA